LILVAARPKAQTQRQTCKGCPHATKKVEPQKLVGISTESLRVGFGSALGLQSSAVAPPK
jgi:hypothetical protein